MSDVTAASREQDGERRRPVGADAIRGRAPEHVDAAWGSSGRRAFRMAGAAVILAWTACAPDGVVDEPDGTSRHDDSWTAPAPDVEASPDDATSEPPDDVVASPDADVPVPEDACNVARIGKPEGIEVRADGSWGLTDDDSVAAIGREFYRDHPDDYDFLAVYTEGEFLEFYALAVAFDYSVRGIGIDGSGFGEPTPADAGSGGRLQQIDLMNIPSLYAFDPSGTDILVHETVHRWAAYVLLADAPFSDYLLDGMGGHWNLHVHTGGPSAVGYGDSGRPRRRQIPVHGPVPAAPLAARAVSRRVHPPGRGAADVLRGRSRQL